MMERDEKRVLVPKKRGLHGSNECSPVLKKVKIPDDPVNKLDKQVAELKRRQQSAKNLRNGSPKQKYAILGTMDRFNDDVPNHFPVLSPKAQSKDSRVLGTGNQKRTKDQTVLENSTKDAFLKHSRRSLDSLDFAKHPSMIIPDTQIINPSLDLNLNTSHNNNIYNTAEPKQSKPLKIMNLLNHVPAESLKVPDLSNVNVVQVPNSSQSSVTSKESTNTEPYNEHIFSSSPMKSRAKKQVKFSSDIEASSPLNSSPIRENQALKSILKSPGPVIVPPNFNRSFADVMLEKDLSKNESWQPGVILQIPSNCSHVIQIVQACANGLKDKGFLRQYEVYATFNDLLKRNNKLMTNPNIFTREITKIILVSVKNGILSLIVDLKRGADAFKLRTSSQGLKLLCYLNTETLELREMSEIYDLAVKLLKSENISKGLASTILQLIKLLPESMSEKTEHIICSLIQMKYFSSATLLCEKLNILKRFILNYPAIAAKCNYQIFSYILFTILNTDVPAYSKILFTAISIFTVSARNDESKMAISKLLVQELNDLCSTIKSCAEQEQPQPWMTIAQALCENLKYLIHIELYPQAAKIWSYVLYMFCHRKKRFHLEKWELFLYFEKSFMTLYTKPEGLSLALEAWKSVVYNFQMCSIKELSQEELDNKLELIMLPFGNIQLNGNSDAPTINQWTKNEGYVVLYCRICYSLRVKLEDESLTENQVSSILKTMLRPLLQLKEWDNVWSFILRMIFTSERYFFLELPEMCFWLSDFEKWKNRILPLPKRIFKSRMVYSTILEFVKQFATKNIELLTNLVEICVAFPTETLKAIVPFEEYCEISVLANDLVVYIFDVHSGIAINGISEDAKMMFSLLEKFDEVFLFSCGHSSVIRRLLDSFAKCEHVEFVNEFVSLCRQKFDHDKLFEICLSSNLYHNEKLVRSDIGEFPPFLHYNIDMKNLKLNHDNMLRINDNLYTSMKIYLENDGSYAEIIEFLLTSNILNYLNTEMQRQLFLFLVEIFNGIDFYTETPTVFFQGDLKNDVEILTKLPNPESIPQNWIKEIESKLQDIGIAVSNDEFSDFLRVIQPKLSKSALTTIQEFLVGSDDQEQLDVTFADENDDPIPAKIDCAAETGNSKSLSLVAENVDLVKSFIIDSIQVEGGGVSRNIVRTPIRTPTHSALLSSSPTPSGSRLMDKTLIVRHTSPARRTRSYTHRIDETQKRKIDSDITELRKCLRKVNSKKVNLDKFEKEELERELLDLLVMLKKSV